jgi:hypothetical protein
MPAAWAGVVAVIVALFVTFILLAGNPPKLTVAPVANPLPLIVTDVPPFVVPEFGDMAETTGVGLVDVSNSSSIFGAVEAAPGKLVSPKASAVILSTL